MRNEQQQGQALDVLRQAIPYAQSKEELGQLMNMYRSYLGSTQDAPFTQAKDVYNLTTIPGTSGDEHGMKSTPIDWGPQTEGMQRLITAYQGRLPGTALSDMSQVPQGQYEPGSDYMRLWAQFLNRPGTAPPYSPGIPGYTLGADGGEHSSPRDVPAVPEGPNYAPNPAGGGPAGIPYGEPGYNYQRTGWPEPGQYFGEVNPLYTLMMNPTGNPSAFNSMNTNPQGNSLQGSLGFAGLRGPANELDGADNPNRL
jgi:hypothetical protein